MAERKVVTNGTHREQEYTIIKTSEDKNTGNYEYEYLLHIKEDLVATSSELESRGWSGPWETALERYAEVYIEGAQAQSKSFFVSPYKEE